MVGPLSFFSGAVFVPPIRARPSELVTPGVLLYSEEKPQAGYGRASSGPLEYHLIKHHL
jgi:hypothetical protein